MAWTTPARQSTGTLITAATWNLQVANNMEFLGTNHDHNGDAGDGATLLNFSSGAIALFDAACPSGWTQFAALNNKFLRGAATYGGTGGVDVHTHTLTSLAAHTHVIGSHTHSGAGGTIANSPAVTQVLQGVGTNYAIQHSHGNTNGATGNDAGETSGAASPTLQNAITYPAFVGLILCKKD